MNRLMLVAALPVFFSSPSTLLAGQPYEALDAGDVFVATITRVEDKDATNSRPPRVWLEVHEVLRGEDEVPRSPALWSPRFHGIDWGDGNQPELKRWNATSLKGPRVGQKYILGGRALNPGSVDRDAPAYDLFAFVRIPYSDEARATAIRTLANLEAAHRKYAAEQAAAAKEREHRRQQWRAAMTDKVIDKRTQQADTAAIGRIVSGSTVEIETLLKGQPRMSTGGKYFVTLPADGFDPRIADLVFERPRCILFLSEEQLIASVTSIHARLVDPYEGIVPADAAAIAVVKASLQKRPAPKPRPVLVISALNRTDAGPLERASLETFAIVISHQFSAHGPQAIEHVRNTIPGANFLVMIDRGPQRRVVAVQLTADAATTIYEAIWEEADIRAQIPAFVKALAETAD